MGSPGNEKKSVFFMLVRALPKSMAARRAGGGSLSAGGYCFLLLLLLFHRQVRMGRVEDMSRVSLVFKILNKLCSSLFSHSLLHRKP